ncbi:hypothetical protein ACFP1Z_15075 [Streptomyces gamaensis]|uniref:Lipoprotein n=1 Tax=Streptomyces gamaensis TaxID=1763542 RepID=A0ABW0Z183_9ACTN
MRARRTLPAAALALALGTLLAGCGVTTTDVVDMGVPATGVKRPGEKGDTVQLYFMSPTGVRGTTRMAKARLGAEGAVALLLDGPFEAERARGLYSELPGFPPRSVQVTVDGRQVRVQLPLNPTVLSPVARSQIVCTAADNDTPVGGRLRDTKVVLTDGNAILADMICDNGTAFPDAKAPSPSPGTGLTGGAAQ